MTAIYSTYQARQEKNFLYNLWLAIFIADILLYLFAANQTKNKNHTWSLVFAILALVISITATQLTKNPIIWIPIVISGILALYELTRMIR